MLARLLAPNDIGLFATAMVVLSFLERFSNTGIQAALVQMRSDPRPYLSTAWTISILRSIVLAGALAAAGGAIAGFLGAPAAAPLVQLLGLSMLLRGMENTGVVMLQRDFQGRRQFCYRFSGLITDLAVSIAVAITLKSAWALVWGLLAGNFMTLLVSYLVHPYRPRFHLDWLQARELGRFGRWVFLSNVLFFLAYQGDNAVVAKLFGAEALGFYVLAYALAEAATVEISLVLGNNVAFPAYAKLQLNRGRLVAAHALTTELVASVAIPAAVLLTLLAQPLVHVLLGGRWAGVAALLPPLAIAGSIKAIVNNGKSVCSAVGRPEQAFLIMLVGVVATYAAMLPLVQLFGVRGVGMAVLFGAVSTLAVYIGQARRTLGVPVAMLSQAIAPGMFLGCTAALPALLVGHLSAIGTPASLMLVGVAAGLAYAVSAVFLWRRFGAGPLRLVQIARHRSASLLRAV